MFSVETVPYTFLSLFIDVVHSLLPHNANGLAMQTGACKMCAWYIMHPERVHILLQRDGVMHLHKQSARVWTCGHASPGHSMLQQRKCDVTGLAQSKLTSCKQCEKSEAWRQQRIREKEQATLNAHTEASLSSSQCYQKRHTHTVDHQQKSPKACTILIMAHVQSNQKLRTALETLP